MKKSLFLFLVSCFSFSLWATDATMYQWKTYFAYGSVSQVVDAGQVVYSIASGSLCAINKQTEQVTTYTKLSGMNGSEIATMAYDDQSQTLVIAYADGMIDLLCKNQFVAITDLQQKMATFSKRTNKIVIEQSIAYFCMPFGIMALDIQKRQIKDTYYIGEQGKDVDVLDLAFDSDSIYAISSSVRYSASHDANWMDFVNWHRTSPLPSAQTYRAIVYWQNSLFVLINKSLQQRKGDKWSTPYTSYSIDGLCMSNNQMFLLMPHNGIYYLGTDYSVQYTASAYQPLCIAANGSTYWLATDQDGVVRQTPNDVQSFSVNGPVVNIPYRLKLVNNKLYMLAGQRWATENPKMDANIMMYDIQQDWWTNIYSSYIEKTAGMYVFDLMNVAEDPSDPSHFYVTTYGTGLLECQGEQLLNRFSLNNSVLESATTTELAYRYVRCDGALFDAQSNLWILNAGVANAVHVASPQQLAAAQQTGNGNWYSRPLMCNKVSVVIHTPGELFIDNRYPNWKWIPSCRVNAGLFLLDDNNTPFDASDDVVVDRTSFVDQDGNSVIPGFLYAVAQDKNGAIWMAMSKGLAVIPSSVDPKTSNRCERIKVPRNDGTGLADYLLETEVIKAIAVDGANRKWIGTESSGLYLVSEDGLETIFHFTKENSPLIDNSILSLAVHPTTGCVYVGTSSGLMSFQSDAASSFAEYSSVYAYPNPVRPDYEGVITISGLMDGTIVHVLDNAGNLVCETRSNGGLAIWDGKTADGHRAASGVYIVFLNESGGNHAVTKILLMH